MLGSVEPINVSVAEGAKLAGLGYVRFSQLVTSGQVASFLHGHRPGVTSLSRRP
jgi:hypothetical protein